MKFIGFFAFFLILFQWTPVSAAPLSFTVNMSEAVTVTGTPRIAVDVGGVTRYADYASGSGSSALTFTYSPQEGDLDLDGISISSPVDLNGGTITDLNGNPETDLTFTVPNTSGVKIDYPSLSMDFISNDYILSGTHYNSLASFLSAAGGTFSRNSVGTYFDLSETMQTASANVPRFDYDPVTHAAKGILIEESRTNLARYSADLTNGIWWKGNTTVTPNATTAPDGTLTAGKVVENTATAAHVILNNGTTVTAGSVVTASLFVKSAERAIPRVYLYSSSDSSAAYAALDSNYNVTGSGLWWGSAFSGISAKSESIGNGWYRVSVTATTSGTTAGVGVYLNSGGAYTGDGTSGAYVWGAQIEVGAFPTSYIPTTTAAVTRQADSLLMPTGGWFNATEGAILANAFNGQNGSTVGIVSIDNSAGSGVNRLTLIRITTTNIEAMSQAGGVVQFQTARVGNGDFALNKMGIGYKTNRFIEALNGSLSLLDTVGSVPTVDRMRIGVWGGAGYYDGWVQQVKYYPARVSDTQLQLLTQ